MVNDPAGSCMLSLSISMNLSADAVSAEIAMFAFTCAPAVATRNRVA
jgi:hypothetical protein